MKWTENGITFEGTVEEYAALHPTNQFPRDYMCKPGLKWSTEPDQPNLNLENA